MNTSKVTEKEGADSTSPGMNRVKLSHRSGIMSRYKFLKLIIKNV